MMKEYDMNDRGPAVDGLDIYMRIEGLNAGGRANSLQYEMGLMGKQDRENTSRMAAIRSLLASILAAKV